MRDFLEILGGGRVGAGVFAELDVGAKGVFGRVPEPGAADGDILPMEGVVLDEVDRRGQDRGDFLERVPPKIVVALDHYFCPRQFVDPLQIGDGVLEFERPREVAGHQDEVGGSDHRFPVRGDFLGVRLPCGAEHVHALVFHSETEVKIGDRPNAGLLAHRR